MRRASAVLATCIIAAHAQVKPVVTNRTLSDRPSVVRVAPRFVTSIKLPEPVSSVIVGDPLKFLAEHAEKEPALVFVKPVVEEPAESNLLVTTISGRHISFVLRSEGGGAKLVDFVVAYRQSGTFLIDESDLGSAEIPGTVELRPASVSVKSAAVGTPPAKPAPHPLPEPDALDRLLERQQRASLPILYGMRPRTAEGDRDHVSAGVSEVMDAGRNVVVLFSVVNPQRRAIEIMPPQIQLAGKIRNGWLIRRCRWGTSEQLPVAQFRLSPRRVGPGDRADGVVVFTRPNFKQSNESLFLQIAESGAVDKPALAPIGFGVSALTKEHRNGE